MRQPERGPWITDVSSLVRMGLKGPRAAEWLTDAGISVPAQPNRWQPMSGAGSSWSLIARLGSTEFFLEEDADTARLTTLLRALGDGTRHVYPVLRQDRAFVLGGQDVESVLAQVCNVDFGALELAANDAVLTLMIGVAVLVVPQAHEGGRRYRIWCDPSFGHYVWSSLAGIVDEANGQRVAIGELANGPRLANNERKRQ